MSIKVFRELWVRFMRIYFDEQWSRIGSGQPIETEEQFSRRMGWPREPEGQLPF